MNYRILKVYPDNQKVVVKGKLSFQQAKESAERLNAISKPLKYFVIDEREAQGS